MKDIVAVHLAEYEAPPACVASAPATVKLLGEHTASNDGIVLAAAISFEMKGGRVPSRKDSSMRFFAADLGERKRASSSTALKYKARRPLGQPREIRLRPPLEALRLPGQGH